MDCKYDRIIRQFSLVGEDKFTAGRDLSTGEREKEVREEEEKREGLNSAPD
jgi:hypothetical protein